ncbi:MAG: hypothetical protein K2X47_07855 [Bdellovibrionales bacterium]|nr:hypothetical protein [Bdellovibrionales bacterium]
MKIQFLIVPLACLSLLLNVSCTSVLVRPGVPIEARGTSFLTRTYAQDGTFVATGSVFSELASNPKTAHLGSTTNTLFWTSGLLAGAGGYCVGYSLFSSKMSSEEKNKMLLGGIGLIGLSAIATYYLDQYATEALEIYNSNASKKKSKLQAPKTQISMLDSGRGLGISLAWSID